LTISDAFLLVGTFGLIKSGYKAFRQDIADRRKRILVKKPGTITVSSQLIPLHEWDLRLLPTPKYFAWQDVINCPVIDKKFLKLLPFLFEDDVDISEISIPESEMSRRISYHHHTCITADLICVYCKTPYIKNHLTGRVEGILTICPNCRRQVGFNGKMMN
jgi:hypothetical protein